MRKKFVLTSLVVALSVSTLFGCSESNNKEQETTQTAAESTESTGNTGEIVVGRWCDNTAEYFSQYHLS